MSNLVEHAKNEFRAAKWTDHNGTFADDMQELMCKQVMELLDLFSSHGHSGFSANYALNLFDKLAKFEPIVPLTGEDWEWNDMGGGTFQNKRCSHVFKENGKAFDIRGRIFRLPDGSCYTGKDSRVDVRFPYTPKSEYVDVEE